MDDMQVTWLKTQDQVLENRKETERQILIKTVAPEGLKKSRELKTEAENDAKAILADVERVTNAFIQVMNESSSGAWTKKVESVARQTAVRFKEVSF